MPDMTQPRHPAGAPTGGQFAPGDRPAADAVLDAATIDAVPYDPMASKTMRCTFCGDKISVNLGTEGGGWMSYEVADGYECDNVRCSATWTAQGELEHEPADYYADERQDAPTTIRLAANQIDDLASQIDAQLAGQWHADQCGCDDGTAGRECLTYGDWRARAPYTYTAEATLAALIAVQRAGEAYADEHGPLRRQGWMSDRDWAVIEAARAAS